MATLTTAGITFGDATTQTTAATAGSFETEQFVSTTTWTAPAGVTQVRATAIGGGGGGGSSNLDVVLTGGPGGYAGVGVGIYTVTPGTTYTVTVGAGGAGNNSTGGGSAGAESWFGVNSGTKLISATGGSGGSGGTGIRGASGSSSDGTLRRTTSQYNTYAQGLSFRDSALASTAAVAWSISSTFTPGAPGTGEGENSENSSGGVGGIIVLEYVG